MQGLWTTKEGETDDVDADRHFFVDALGPQLVSGAYDTLAMMEEREVEAENVYTDALPSCLVQLVQDLSATVVEEEEIAVAVSSTGQYNRHSGALRKGVAHSPVEPLRGYLELEHRTRLQELRRQMDYDGFWVSSSSF